MTQQAAQDGQVEHASSQRGAGKVMLALRDIKLAHSVFALPFALLAVFLARPRGMQWGALGMVLGLVVVCMVCARTWAMLVNRVADARLDAANPRTKGRAIASGALGVRDGVVLAGASAVAFVVATALFGVLLGNWWPVALSVPVLGWVGVYSFTKRFTWLCHVFLGGALAASPIAAAIAVDPASLGSVMSLYWLSGMVVLWVAGFDVIYALADLEYDRSAGLHSIPARFGWKGAAWISRAMHVGALACLTMAWLADDRLGMLFGVAVGLVAGLLVVEHAIVARRGKAGLSMAFFTVNGIVSCLLGTLGIIDVLI